MTPLGSFSFQLGPTTRFGSFVIDSRKVSAMPNPCRYDGGRLHWSRQLLDLLS